MGIEARSKLSIPLIFLVAIGLSTWKVRPRMMTKTERLTMLVEDISWPKAILIALVAAIVLREVSSKVLNLFRSNPIDLLPTTKRKSWLFGNFAALQTEAYAGQTFLDLRKQLDSSVFGFPTPMGATSIVLGDVQALNHVLHDIVNFPSTVLRLEFVRFVVGEGIIVANAKDHARQRRVMGPAFTQPHIRSLAPIFNAKADELGDKLVDLARNGGQEEWKEKGTGKTIPVVNVSELLDCVSFDIIGKAGFGIDFGCLKNGLKNVSLADGYQEMLQASVTFDFGRILLLTLSAITKPSWLGLPLNRANLIVRAQNARVKKMTADVVKHKVEKVAQLMKAEKDGAVSTSVPGQDDVTREDGDVIDLVELMVRANARLELKGQRAMMLSNEEIQGSIRTLLFAGYETSAVATTFTLHYLANNQAVLRRVEEQIKQLLQLRRSEGREAEGLSAEELQGEELELLTNCIKETLRLAPAVTASDRMAKQDCTIPLSRPIPTRDGKDTMSEITVKKGW
jgi:cytochrome P450